MPPEYKDLMNMKCQNSKDVVKLNSAEIIEYLKKHLPQWEFNPTNNFISRKFEFKNFKQTLFFINAVAYICEKDCHHPDAKFGYNYCEINLSTHDAGGVSINDLILSHKIDSLIK